MRTPETPEEDLCFEVTSVLGKRIRTTRSYWGKLITAKHPVMRGREGEVQEALKRPYEVRRSRLDTSVYLYYMKRKQYYVCAVIKHLNGEGFLITAYLTEAVKIGEVIWKE